MKVKNVTVEIKSLKDVLKDSAEVMVHPGKESSYSPLKGDFLVKAKHKELAALVDPGAKDLLKKYNVKLVSYRDL